MPIYSKKNVLIIPLCLAIFSARANTPKPSSALEYQQTTNTRIVVEENHLRFFTGGSERMTIGANGNVGIGVDEPNAILHIKGSYAGGSGDHTNIDNAQLKLESSSGYVRIPHISASSSVSTVYNFQSGKNIYWGEPSDGGSYFFRGRDLIVENGNVGIGTTSPGNYRLNVYGQMKTSGLIDIGLDRPTDASTEGLFIKGVDGTGHSSINLATRGWSGSHAILFEAYKSLTQVNGSLYSTGNTKFTHSQCGYSGGAGGLIYNAHGGAFSFVISGESTGSGNDITWGTQKMRIQRDGTVGINTNDPDENYKLHVAGGIRATNYKSDVNSYADFVFEDDYRLTPLSEVEAYIEENNHLPDIPSEAEARKNGVDLQDMQAKLLQKIEELTLYVIEQQKRIEKLESNQKITN